MKLFNKNIKIASWILSPFLMGLVLLLVYFIRGIYPFGSNNIAYYDMAGNYVPAYTGIWDVLHGDGGLFWDWYSGGGVPGGLGILFHPINLFYLFVSRENIVNTFSIFLMLKVILAAFSMSYFFDKKYPSVDFTWKILSGVVYASSGYTLLYYTNIQFLELVFSFPLLIYSLDLVLEKKNKILFIILMSLDFIVNMQMTFMICIYLVIYTYLFVNEKEGKCKSILNLGICTLVSLACSAITWLPASISMVHATRAENATSAYQSNIYLMLIHEYDYIKIFMLYGTEFIIAYLIYCILMKSVAIKNILKELKLCGFMMAPIFIETINIAWHIGGYASFPMRFSYMLNFSFVLLLGKILAGIDYSNAKSVNVLRKAIEILIGIVGVAILFYFIWPLHIDGAFTASAFKGYCFGFIMITIAFLLLYKLGYNVKCVCVVVMFQIIIGWYVLLTPTEASKYAEASTNYISYSNDISYAVQHVAPDEDVRIARVRDDSASMATNYPAVVHNTAMSTWYYSSNGNVLSLVHKLGFSDNYIRVLDTGATMFSDALFHVRKIISFSKEENDAYTNIFFENGYYLKENTLYYPYGIFINEEIKNWYDDEVETFEYQNRLFDVIHNLDAQLYEIYEVQNLLIVKNEQLDDDFYYSSFEIPVEGRRALYLKNNEDNGTYIFGVNGIVVEVPDLENPTNTVYPVSYNNGNLYLGIFEDEIISLEIASSNIISDDSISIAAMDINLLKEKTEEQHKYEREITPTNNGLKYKVNNTDGYPYLLLPIGFQDKFWCKVNGKFVECEPCVEDALTLIPIEEGMNEISLVYIPRGLITGAIISVIGLIALIIMWKRWDVILEIKWLQNVANVCFTLLFWAIIVCIYIIPTIAEVVLRFIWNPFGI